VEWIFLLSGGLTLAYMARLFYILFVAPKPEHQHRKAGRYMTPMTASVLVIGGGLLPLLGLTAHATMDKIAGYAPPFFHVYTPEHAVRYFAWINLKGAVISICIGTAVFLLVGMKCLTRREKGSERYLNVWPKRLDLEDLVYRPFLRLLASIGGVFGKLIELPGAFLVNGRGFGWMLTLGTALARLVETLGALLVLTPINLIFLGAKDKIVPPEDGQFSAYAKQSERSRVSRSFSSDLLYAACGVLALLLLAAWNMRK
jgi:hydrogenase-4 component B